MSDLQAFGSLFTNFSHVLPTSHVGYHASKPTESVVYCFYKITLKHVSTNQNVRTILVIL